MYSDSERILSSVRRLLSRGDVWLNKEIVDRYLANGEWVKESFVDCLENAARKHPGAPAIIDENGKVTTYGEYDEQSTRFALGLLSLGLRAGDTIAIQLPNCSEFLISLLGCAKAGILPVLCHMPYTVHDLEYVLSLTKARAIVVPDAYRGRDYVRMSRALKEQHPGLEFIVTLSGDNHTGTVRFQDLQKIQSREDEKVLSDNRPVGTDPFFVMFTSGTTGRPKAELHLHANNMFWVNQFNAALQFPTDAKWLIVTPIAHLTGLGIGCLGALYRGAPVVLLTQWDTKRAVEVIERDEPAYFLGAPPMLIDLARFEELEKRKVKSVKVIAYAGAPCPAGILQTLHKRIGAEVIAFYGYTEAGATHCTQSGDDIRLTSRSFGRLIHGLEEQIVDAEGTPLIPPSQGEIWVRGPSFIPGYYGQKYVTGKMFDKAGWFHSADVVNQDENFYCEFVSRRDDLINRGGYKIDPREIEEVLYTHPLISQAAIVAMPDERLGQRAAAFVVLKDSRHTISLQDITQYLEEHGVGKTHWPEAVKIVESFPMTSTGKFQRYALRKEAAELRPQE